VILKTRGDKLQHLALAKLDDKGFFTREIEEALLDGRVDLAVHSLKDLPSEQPPGLALGAISEREDPADLLLGTEGELAGVVRVGTSSLRRQIQVLEGHPAWQVVPVRGNVPTRVEHLREGRTEKLVLAAAGVRRLGLVLDGLVVERLDPAIHVPAPGQGALGLQIRDGDEEMKALLAPLHHAETAEAVAGERNFLQRAGGGCNLPLGAWARREGGTWRLSVCLGGRGWQPGDEACLQRGEFTGSDPVALGEEAWQALGTGWHADPPPTGPRVILTASEPVALRQAASFRKAGMGVVLAPLIRIQAVMGDQELEAAVAALVTGDWLVFTSGAGARSFLERVAASALPPGLRTAAIGTATAHEVQRLGLAVEWVCPGNGSAAFVEAFPPCQEGAPAARFLLPCAEDALDVIPQALQARGHSVTRLALYRSTPTDPEALRGTLDVDADFILFSSPSGVSAFCALDLELPGRPIALGPATAQALVAIGLDPLVADLPDPASLVKLVRAAVPTGE
jgi:hydroxymethylbilane synthase